MPVFGIPAEPPPRVKWIDWPVEELAAVAAFYELPKETPVPADYATVVADTIPPMDLPQLLIWTAREAVMPFAVVVV